MFYTLIIYQELLFLLRKKESEKQGKFVTDDWVKRQKERKPRQTKRRRTKTPLPKMAELI
jgi:hypothetical protein